MVSIFRVTTTWSGFNGAPGYTNHFFRNVLPGGAPTEVDDQISAAAGHDRVHAFFNTIKQNLPDDVKLTVEPNVDELEDTNGELLNSFALEPKAILTGAQAGAYSAATGAVVAFSTGTIHNKRRIRGRTFLIPLAGVAFGLSGRLQPAVVTLNTDAAKALAIGGLNSTFGIWARPVVATDRNPDVEPRAGKWGECTGVRSSDLPAVLRSRRD